MACALPQQLYIWIVTHTVLSLHTPVYLSTTYLPIYYLPTYLPYGIPTGTIPVYYLPSLRSTDWHIRVKKLLSYLPTTFYDFHTYSPTSAPAADCLGRMSAADFGLL